MDVDTFCLKWNDFQNNVSKTLSDFRRDEEFFDVTLVSEDLQHISAHKLVLSACSELFKLILRKWLSCRNESRILLVHVVYFLQLNILHVKLQSKYYYIASIKNQFVDPEWGILVCTVNLHYVESHHRENLPNRVFKDHWVSRTPLSPRTGWPDNYSYLVLPTIETLSPVLRLLLAIPLFFTGNCEN